MAIFNGTSGPDTIEFSGYGDTARGGAGDDTIRFEVPEGGGDVRGAAFGDAGADELSFGISSGDAEYEGNVTLRGGAGNDTLGGTLGFEIEGNRHPASGLSVSLYGDAGNDQLSASFQFTGSSYVPEEGGNNRDLLYGGAGNDTYRVQEQQDVVIEKAGGGYDTVIVNNSFTSNYTLAPHVERVEVWDWYADLPCDLTGNGQANAIAGSDAANVLKGMGGDDLLMGNAGDDLLIGGTGGDTFYGDAGEDVLRGGAGSDQLFSGEGNDQFDYNAVSDLRRGEANRDVILNFEGIGGATGDLIDLATIDANSSAGGNQAFAFRGTRAFSAPGQVRVQDAGADGVLVQVNTAGRNRAEMEIMVTDGQGSAGEWSATDFIL